MSWIKIYLVAFMIFLVLDALWLGIIGKDLYQGIITDKIKWGAALLFYVIYISGLVHFAIVPCLNVESALCAFFQGAFFGLVCYATYDLTNYATLSGWPLKIVIYDLLWGSFASGITCLTSYGIIKYFNV